MLQCSLLVTSYDIDQYVYDLDIVKIRRILASFRYGIHCLYIKHINNNSNLMYININKIFIENEFNLIIDFPLFNSFREHAMYTNSSIEKLYLMFCSRSAIVIPYLECFYIKHLN